MYSRRDISPTNSAASNHANQDDSYSSTIAASDIRDNSSPDILRDISPTNSTTSNHGNQDDSYSSTDATSSDSFDISMPDITIGDKV